MNILVISHMYPSDVNYMSGIFVHNQVKNLIRLGYNVRVIAPIPKVIFPFTKLSKDQKLYSKIPFKTEYEGVIVYHPYYLVYPKGLLFYNNGIRMYKGMKKLIENINKEFKIDIIHSHVALPDGLCGNYAKSLLNVPNVVTIHGDDFQNTMNKGKKYRDTIRKVLNNTDEVVAVSNKLKEMVKNEEYYNKIKIVYNGIDLKKQKDIKCDVSEVKHESNSINILSVSTLYKTKGVHINLNALKNIINDFPQVKYTIVGDGPEKQNLINQVKELGLDENVEFKGYVSHCEAIKYMKTCDIFSLPSYKEAFGIVYIEAMAEGKPIIGIKGQGIEDVIDNGKNGFLVPPKDDKSLEVILRELIQDKNKREQVGMCAKQTVLSELTWERNALEMDKIYKKLWNNNNK